MEGKDPADSYPDLMRTYHGSAVVRDPLYRNPEMRGTKLIHDAGPEPSEPVRHTILHASTGLVEIDVLHLTRAEAHRCDDLADQGWSRYDLDNGLVQLVRLLARSRSGLPTN